MVLNKIKIDQFVAIIFDLDDTVYDEIEYLKKAYSCISKKIIESDEIIHFSEYTIYDFLLKTFINEGRERLFQKLVQKFNIINFTIEQFLDCLRTVNINENEIQIKKPIMDFINYHQGSKELFILTNGNVTQQKNKIRSLDIPFKEKMKVYYSSSLGKKFEKPNPYYIFKILYDHNLKKKQTIYIGDSEIDKLTAKAAGVDFLAYEEFSLYGNLLIKN